MKNGDKKTKKAKTPKEKLIEKMEKHAGIEGTRQRLKELREFVSEPMLGLDMQKVREEAWK